MNPAGLWWNGTSFEAYDAGNYADYVIAMTEQGSSGVYVADFPSAITSSGTYEYFVHQQAGGSPAEGDSVLDDNTETIDWTGTASASAATGSMTGSDWRAYVLRLGFKRTDKDTELYEATTDAIQEMRRRFMFDEAETETTTTDTISVDGDFKLTLETDFGLLLGIVLEYDDTGTPLVQVPKWKFDQLYPSINVESDRGYPRHFCIYGGSIYIGPIPDQTTYVYRISYSLRAGTVTSSTSGVPFTNVYRDVLADLTLAKLYKALEEFDKSAYFVQEFEKGFLLATRKETANSGVHCFNVRAQDC
jgi:hypothetical protein